MKRNVIRLICISSVFAALVFVVTAYLHIPTLNGYVHVGDAFVYLAAAVLPWQYAALVGGIGALLADLLTGYAIWAPASLLIKALSALMLTSVGKKIICARNLIALMPASALCIGGYYLYEALIFNNFTAALAGIPASITQSVASAVLFVAVGAMLDRLKFKQKIKGDKRI